MKNTPKEVKGNAAMPGGSEEKKKRKRFPREKPRNQGRKEYPSDISREQFELIRSDLENFKKRTRPREVDLYDVFCGLLYLLRSGCQWRMIPSDFPDWHVIYSYYAQWRKRIGKKPSLLERGLKKIGWRGPDRPWEESAYQLRHH